MSKERLEEAKLMAEMLRVETRLPHDFPFDLVDWLIDQAERVQELERQASRHKEQIIQCALRKNQQKQTLSRNNRALYEKD